MSPQAPFEAAEATQVPAFLASQFTGMTLYTLDSDATRDLRSTAPMDDAARDQTAPDDQTIGWDRRMERWTSSDAFIAQRDHWESVGSIGDIVMTQDGEIRGILIDVGGFLGFFARTVMIDIDDLYFVADDTMPEELSDFFVVATLSRDQLEALPEWSDDALHAGFVRRDQPAPEPMAPTDQGAAMQEDGQVVPPDATTDATGSAAAEQDRIGIPGAPAAPPEGYVVVDATVPTVEQLLGATVHDATGDAVGNVDDLTLAQDGAVAELIVDIGGFLGIGAHTVALPAANTEILWNQADDSVRVHLPMNREQLETLPEYQG